MLLTVSEASDPSESGDGHMRHIPIHAEGGVGGSRGCRDRLTSPPSGCSSHLPNAEEEEERWERRGRGERREDPC